jgi:hypothetical protein
MRTAFLIGSMIVTLALVFYSLGYLNERKRQLITASESVANFVYFTIIGSCDLYLNSLFH